LFDLEPPAAFVGGLVSPESPEPLPSQWYSPAFKPRLAQLVRQVWQPLASFLPGCPWQTIWKIGWIPGLRKERKLETPGGSAWICDWP
jgi:hypothetical protein